MAFNWDQFGVKTYKALKKYGIPAVVTVNRSTGVYNVITGKDGFISTDYDTHGIMKNFEVSDRIVADIQEVEISFHSGSKPDIIPDLSNEDNIKITIAGKIYKVIDLIIIRPSGITMMYKARSVESKDA